MLVINSILGVVLISTSKGTLVPFQGMKYQTNLITVYIESLDSTTCLQGTQRRALMLLWQFFLF